MTLKVAFQMEVMEETCRLSNHTLLLMQEAQDRGYLLYHFEPKNLSIIDGKILARAREVSVNLDNNPHYQYGKNILLNLSEIDVIHIRQDPPFNMEYITSTYILERVFPNTLVVNNPFWIRNLPEKIYTFDFAEFMPPTLITQDMPLIEDFRNKHKDIIIKPLYDFHGNGVIHITPIDVNFDAYLEMMLGRNSEPLIIQKYIPEIKEGNKRVIFIDGEIAGSLITTPESGEFRIYRNSTDHRYELNERDKKICDAVSRECKEKGLLFVGIDIIGDYLTEINVTSVGSIRRLNQLYDTKIEAEIWDAIERKL